MDAANNDIKQTMEKQFVLAKQKRVNVKIIVLVAVIFVVLILNYIDEKFGKPGGGGYSPWFLLLLFPFLIFAFWVDSIRNYKPAGQVLINPSVIKIEKRGVMEIIPFEEISGLEFRFKCVSGESAPSKRAFGLLSLAASNDGSGNYLYFWFNGINYKLNLVLESKEDFNAVVHLFRMIEENHGLRPVITGYNEDE